MSIKTRALEIYNQHLDLANIDGKAFRRTVMNQIQLEFNCTISSAATAYNNAKKSSPKIAGLGRENKTKIQKEKKSKTIQNDNDCYSVLELINNSMTVGRTESFLTQDLANSKYIEQIRNYPNSNWVLIQGLGPNPDEQFYLLPGEREICRNIEDEIVS